MGYRQVSFEDPRSSFSPPPTLMITEPESTQPQVFDFSEETETPGSPDALSPTLPTSSLLLPPDERKHRRSSGERFVQAAERAAERPAGFFRGVWKSLGEAPPRFQGAGTPGGGFFGGQTSSSQPKKARPRQTKLLIFRTGNRKAPASSSQWVPKTSKGGRGMAGSFGI